MSDLDAYPVGFGGFEQLGGDLDDLLQAVLRPDAEAGEADGIGVFRIGVSGATHRGAVGHRGEAVHAKRTFLTVVDILEFGSCVRAVTMQAKGIAEALASGGDEFGATAVNASLELLDIGEPPEPDVRVEGAFGSDAEARGKVGIGKEKAFGIGNVDLAEVLEREGSVGCGVGDAIAEEKE